MRWTQLALLLQMVVGGLACAHCGDARQTQQTDADATSPARDAGDSDATTSRDMDAGADTATPGDPTDAASADGRAPIASQDAASNDAAADPASNDAALDAALPLPAHTFVYVGGYSSSDPLRVYEIDRGTLALRPIAHHADVGPQPSYITPSADGRTLYVANEDDGNPGITVLRVNPATGVPARVDHEDAVSKPYVFSGISPDGKFLLATSYNGGDLGVYPIKADGTLDPRVDAHSFGAGAQSHSVRVHPSGAVFVPNKGLDSVAQLKLDAAGKLSAASPDAFPDTAMRAAFDGPRHIAFSRDRKFAFVILELGDGLYSLAVETNGTLRQLDRKPRKPANSPGDSGAHVLAHPRAKFVYGSNRGTDTLAAFAYDEQGKLTSLGWVASRGQTPRNFDIDPWGAFLVVANQSGSLAVFAIGVDGKLTAKGDVVSGLASPAAVAIVGL